MRLYLDHAATSPLRPAARQAMLAAMDHVANASSIHQEGQGARAILDEARRSIGQLLDVHPGWVVLTSGGTEANNLALRGYAAETGKRILCGSTEHDCVRKTTLALGGDWIKVHPNGQLNLSDLEEKLKKGGIGLVSVMHANNETGVLNDLRPISDLCHAHGALLHTDAVQTVAHIPFTFTELGVDMLTLSGHKFGGPQGIGALVMRPEITLQAQLTGGAQERNRRAGTENILAAAGFHAAIQDHLSNQAAEFQALQTLAHIADQYPSIAAGTPKTPHIRQYITPLKGEDAVIQADLKGLAISQGSACSSGKTQESATLHAMGLTAEAAHAIRLSWSAATSPQHLQKALHLLTA